VAYRSVSLRPLKIGIGGVRGIVGETFTPELVAEFAAAFATYAESGPILVSRDTRPSGPMVTAAVTAGLLAAGCEVIDLGICPTPTLQLAVPWLGARGGVAISAGHNPAEWNALKFVRGDGRYLDVTQADELLDIYHQGEFAKARWERVPVAVASRDAVAHHADRLSRHVDVDRIRARRPRVAVDCCNGACARLTPGWLASLGCTVLAINDDLSAPFPHAPEPSRATAAQLAAVVRAGQADVGFLHDADGERIALVDEEGRALSEETTLSLAAAIVLPRGVGPVVTNVSTSAAIDRVAARHGAPVIRTPVGQSFVSEAVVAHGAVIGGEGNGAVVVPAVQFTHDAAACLALVLDHLSATGVPLSALVDALPAPVMVKETHPVEPNLLYSVLQDFRDKAQDQADTDVDLSDGVKISWPDAWLHVRASNTESLLRVIAEADTAARARELADWARDRLRI
jgi:phosphomannomutase